MLTLEMAVVLGLILVLLLLFFREVLPIPLTALLAAVVLMVTGILTPEEGLSGFSNPATIAVLAMFVLSAGIQQTGAVSALTRRLIAWSGTSHRRQLLALSAASGPVSGFLNNTPIVAVMIPACLQMSRRTGISPSKLLMPVSHMTMLGGLLTIIGTSTNLLGNTTMAGIGVKPFGFFEFSLIGAIALGVGLVYYLTIGAALLPDRGKGDLVERFDLKGFMAEFNVPDGSALAGRSLREAGLTFDHGCQVVRLTRGDVRWDAPEPARTLRAGDQLLVEGSRERLGALARDVGLRPLPEMEHPLGTDTPGPGELATAEVVINPGSQYVGRSIGEIDFRRRYEALVLAVRHQGRLEIGPISKSRLTPGDVLLVQATPKALERMREKPDLFVTRTRERELYRHRRMPHALAIVAGVVLAAALGWLDIAVAALAGAALMVILGCLKMEEFMRSIHWDIILLLAGVIPLGVALTKTGAAQLIADGLVGAGAGLPPIAFLIVVFVVTSVITNVAANNATVVLMIPIAVAAAASLGFDPRPVALAVTMAASTSMMTPIGYQTNTMIYAPGNYRFSDYVRVGGPLNVLLALIIPYTIMRLFPL